MSIAYFKSDFPHSFFHSYICFFRELNEINRKHIQDSVSLIRGVSIHTSMHSLITKSP